mmetsp:Transcript_14362/g.36088  ORF Transcript_14362/g.36088 Transcript_14362/m.36088 type:complete len:298 (-) Transcript_14362:62-955(-)
MVNKMRSRTRNTQKQTTLSVDTTLPPEDQNHWPNNSENLRLLRLQRNVLLLMCMVLFVVLLQIQPLPSDSSKESKKLRDASSCEISLGKYKGPIYNSVESGTIGEPKCLLDSKWMRVSLHTVKFPGSDTTYDDWLWIDYHDRINVLVEDGTWSRNHNDEPRFLVFEQTKYALEGRNSHAIIGGIVEVGEEPIDAAKREVSEEMDGLVCEDFHFLGRFRTDVNRGVGWLNSFLATGCEKHSKLGKDHLLAEEVGAADTEKQKIKSITLSELQTAATEGKFIEVQWTATVTQALQQHYS